MPSAFLLTVLLLAGPEPSGPGDTEKQAIRKILDGQEAAWNRGDLEGFMKGYWKSDQLSFFSGNDRKAGWQVTLERYRARYQGEGKEMGKLRFSEVDIELLSLEAALVRGRFTLETSKGKPTGLFTLILKKRPEGWRIVHDHTSG